MNLQAPVERAARALLGALLAREDVLLRITEVEAYGGPEDSASPADQARPWRFADAASGAVLMPRELAPLTP